MRSLRQLSVTELAKQAQCAIETVPHIVCQRRVHDVLEPLL